MKLEMVIIILCTYFLLDQTKLNVWILDGNPCHSHLLKFSINEESIGDCMVVITVNMAEPWNIVDGLEKWADVLKRHINHLKITEDKLLKHKMDGKFC